MRRSYKLALVVAVAALLGASLTAVAGATHPETTGLPGTFAIINVKLGDKTLRVSKHASTGVQVIGFRIRNVGKKKHNFIVGDFSTNPIAPGQFDDFAVNFNDFGKYHYRCTLNCSRKQRGIINVKRGNFDDVG